MRGCEETAPSRTLRPFEHRLVGAIEFSCQAVHQDQIIGPISDTKCPTPPANFAKTDTLVGANGSLIETDRIEHDIVQTKTGEAVVQHKVAHFSPIALAPAILLTNGNTKLG